MPSTITFTAKDICAALNIPKHQLRNWTEKLYPFSNMETNERSARKYKLSDLQFLAVIDYLDVSFGVSVNRLKPISKELSELINKPATNNCSQNLLYICINNECCKWINVEYRCEEGIVIDVNNAYTKVNEYLGLSPKQVEMQLGLLMVG